jgi:branched-chain amino acid transport system permease protein
MRDVPATARIGDHLAGRARWRPYEIAFWLLVVATVFALPDRHLLLTQIVILGLFALSLDLILGFAGIISLGHAAFFGFGAYLAGLAAKHEIVTEPVLALALAGLAAALLGWATSFLVLRGSDLSRLMVTLGLALVLREIANKTGWLTGGADGLQGVVIGPVLGLFEFDIAGRVAYVYSLAVTFALFLVARRLIYSPFGLSLRALKDNATRASAIGIPARRRLIAIYTVAAGYAGVAGALLAQTTQFASLATLDFERSADVLLVLIIGGTGYLYGGLIGAIVFKLMQDWLADITPQYWEFWIGLLLVVIVLVGHDRMVDAAGRLRGAVARLWPAAGRLPGGASRPAAGG